MMTFAVEFAPLPWVENNHYVNPLHLQEHRYPYSRNLCHCHHCHPMWVSINAYLSGLQGDFDESSCQRHLHPEAGPLASTHTDWLEISTLPLISQCLQSLTRNKPKKKLQTTYCYKVPLFLLRHSGADVCFNWRKTAHFNEHHVCKSGWLLSSAKAKAPFSSELHPLHRGKLICADVGCPW